jgi:hypothetical protein
MIIGTIKKSLGWIKKNRDLNRGFRLRPQIFGALDRLAWGPRVFLGKGWPKLKIYDIIKHLYIDNKNKDNFLPIPNLENYVIMVLAG